MPLLSFVLDLTAPIIGHPPRHRVELFGSHGWVSWRQTDEPADVTVDLTGNDDELNKART